MISVEHDMELSTILDKFDRSRALVVEKEGKYQGMLVEKDLLNVGLPASTKVDRVMRSAPVVTTETSNEEIARLMVENDILQLPVRMEDEVVDIISANEILQSIPSYDPVSDHMTDDVKYLSQDATIAQAISMMRQHQVSRLPIMGKDSILGIISSYDILETLKPKIRQKKGHFMDELKSLYDMPATNLMTRPALTITEDETVKKAVDELLDKSIGGAIVVRTVNDKEILSGIITIKDILSSIAIGKELTPPVIQVSSKYNIDRKLVGDIITAFTEKQKHLRKRSVVNVHIDKHKETHREKEKLYARVRFHTPMGRFIAAGEGFQEKSAIQNALAKIERQIEKKIGKAHKEKEFSTMPQVVR